MNDLPGIIKLLLTLLTIASKLRYVTTYISCPGLGPGGPFMFNIIGPAGPLMLKHKWSGSIIAAVGHIDKIATSAAKVK